MPANTHTRRFAVPKPSRKSAGLSDILPVALVTPPHQRPRRFAPAVIFSLASGLLCACASNGPLPPAREPVALERIPIEYDDHVEDRFAISPQPWQEIVALFHHFQSPEQERSAIALAIARLEQIAGEQTPIASDQRKNRGAGPGKTDCLDESTNTTTFLRLLQEQGLLRHHRVMRKALRSPLQLDIHWTAVIEELATREKWAVDSWYNANGISPIVQPLDDWMKKKSVPGYYADGSEQD